MKYPERSRCHDKRHIIFVFGLVSIFIGLCLLIFMPIYLWSDFDLSSSGAAALLVSIPLLLLGGVLSYMGYLMSKYGCHLYDCVSVQPEMFEPEPPIGQQELLKRQNEEQLAQLKFAQQFATQQQLAAQAASNTIQVAPAAESAATEVESPQRTPGPVITEVEEEEKDKRDDERESGQSNKSESNPNESEEETPEKEVIVVPESEENKPESVKDDD